MSDPTSSEPTPPESSVDLSALQGFTFGPAWTDAGSARVRPSDYEGDERGGRGDRRGGDRGRGPGGDRRGPPRRSGPGGPPRERREGGPGSGPGRREDGGDRGPRREFGGDRGPRRDDGHGHGRPAPYRPTVDVVFYPEDEVFRVLTKAMRQSARTYELFSLARLFLDKPERLQIVVRPRAEAPGQVLYVSVPDGLPFEHEDETVSHVLERHLDRFFTTETVEVDPPKGSFVCVMRCGITGELLGPPNYHRYQVILQEHYAKHVAQRVSFEAFQRRLETVREPEAVAQWLESMKRVTRYTLTAEGPDKGRVFESLESAKFHLTTHAKAALVKTAPFVRLPGRNLEQLPAGCSVRRSIEAQLDHQRRFPLDTANHLRGRLRKLQFSVYKRGTKGVSYVCAVRRKFRTPGQVFAPGLQRLIEFIEQHPGAKATDLPTQVLGLEAAAVQAHEAAIHAAAQVARTKPVAAAPSTPPPAAPEATPEFPAAEATPEAPEAATPEAAEAEAVTEEAPVAEAAEAPAAEAAPAETAAEPEAAASQDGLALDEEQKLALAQLKRDLRWLVSEGYVIEMEDASLHVPAPRSPAEAAREETEEETHSDAASQDQETAASEAPEAAAPAEEAPAADAPAAESPAPEATTEPSAPEAPAEGTGASGAPSAPSA